MNANHDLFLTAPDDLSDESAAQLLDFLRAVAATVENRYLVQIRRYHDKSLIDKRQLLLWEDEQWDDPPF